MTPDQRAIVAAAVQMGMDPSWALSVAERESNFNPRAHSSKTIEGAYQMTGGLRNKYGTGDPNDIGDQTKGWSRFFRQNKYEMSQTLGRDPTDEEGYLGHHFGGTRAARMLRMDPNTPVDQVFTPNEMAVNPHFARAGTVGALNSSILSDMKARHQKFGAQIPDFSGDAEGAPDKPDFSSLGTPVDASSGNDGTAVPAASLKPGNPAGGVAPPAGAIDLSQFGTPV